MGAPARAARLPQPGELVGSKYRIVQALGAGGMGVVYEAEHVKLHTRVAVKMLLPEMLEQGEIVTRFEREARASGALRSAHVAHVTDVDKTNEGLPFMVMDFLEGHDLSAELEARGRLRVDEAIDYILQACIAMEEAHALGIVHRDLKPSNLFVCDDAGIRQIKVLDFGISKILGDDAGVTMTEISFGTPLYMSPEQVRSTKYVDARTDIWSLGVILFELIAGRPPFLGTTTAAAAAIVADSPPSLRKLRPEVPEALEKVILKSLEKDVEDRIATIAQFVAALKPFAPKEPIKSTPSVRAIARTPLSVDAPKLKVLSDGDRNAETFVRPSEKAPGVETVPRRTAMARDAEYRAQAKSRGTKTIALVVGAVLIAAGAVWFLRGPSAPVVPNATSASGTPIASTASASSPPVEAPQPAKAAALAPKAPATGAPDESPLPPRAVAAPAPVVRPIAPRTPAAPPQATRSASPAAPTPRAPDSPLHL